MLSNRVALKMTKLYRHFQVDLTAERAMLEDAPANDFVL